MKHEIEETVVAWQKDNLVRNLSEESMETYRASAKDFLGFFQQSSIARFKQLTDDAIQAYVVGQINRGCMPRTINNRLKAIRRLCYFYQKNFKPSYRIPVFPFQRESATVRGPLTDSEVMRLVEKFDCKNRSSILVAVALDTGLRSKSLRNIRVEDVDIAEKTLCVRVTKNHDTLKQPLTQALAELLAGNIAHFEITSGWLFCNTDGGKMYDRSAVYKSVKRYLQECGVNKTGVHLFRYTFGKIMVKNNCNAMLLQKWLGHRTMEETKKYVKIYSDELNELCEKVAPLSKEGKFFPKKVTANT